MSPSVSAMSVAQFSAGPWSRVVIDNPEMFGRVFSRGLRQFQFAAGQAVNATALQFQAAQRAHSHQVFEIRRTSFVERAVKIKPFARRRTPWAMIQIDPPGGQPRAGIITRHEGGGMRQPFQSRALAVPLGARDDAGGGVIRKTSRPGGIRWKNSFSSLRTRTEIHQGTRRRFMIRKKDGTGWVLERTGKGKSGTFAGTRVLFQFQKQTPVHPVLSFHENADRIFSMHFTPNYWKEVEKAFKTAKLI